MGSNVKKIEKEIMKEIKKEREIFIAGEIKNDQVHRSLVNLCIFPFLPGSKLYNETGYLYICVDPLFEQGIKIFDILIYSEKSCSAILVECKPHLAKPEEEIEDLMEKIKVTKDNMTSIENLCGGKIKHAEYVLSIFATQQSKIEKVDGIDKSTFILWLTDLFDERILRHADFGPHSYGTLNSYISKGIKSEGVNSIVNVMPTSHMCTMLQEICAIVESNLLRSGKEPFSFSGFCEVVRKELRNHPEESIISLSKRIISQGIEIGVFREEVEKKGEEYYSLQGATKDVKRKYIDYKAKEYAKKKKEEEKVKKIKTLNNWT